MGDMQIGVANIDDKGFFGLMEDKPVKAVASPNPSLQVSVSFGRFENDSLSWEKFSAFSPNKYLEEVGKCATPGSVAQKKAYFEAHYKKIAERKAEIMDQEKQIDKNESFRSIVTDQGSIEEGSNEEEDKHVTETDTEVNELSIDEVKEETFIVKECQSWVDLAKEEVKDSPKLEISEEIAFVEEKSDAQEKLEEIAFAEEKSEVVIDVQETPEEITFVEEKSEVVIDVPVKPEEVLQVENVEENEVREEILSNETPMKEKTKEKTQKLIKKDVNVGTNRKRISLKPNQVTKKPETPKIVKSKITPPSKEIKSTTKATRKPAAPISKATPGFSTPRVYKPASKTTSLTTSSASVKKETPSALLRKKQAGPKSLHISMSLGPSASDPTALTSTRKSLIMERMGDKDIVKRAFKSFQKSFDGENTAIKQSPKKVTSISSEATGQKENGRTTKVSSVEKRRSISCHGLKSNMTAEKQQKELLRPGARPVEKTRLQKNPKQEAVIDAKTRRETLKPKAKPMPGSRPV